jgi:hypothetical protein
MNGGGGCSGGWVMVLWVLLSNLVMES